VAFRFCLFRIILHFSYREADTIFGFKHNAYSVRFSGPWYAYPQYPAEEHAKAIRWAAASAAADTRANLGILILPSHARSSHTAALGTPGVHVLATLKRASASSRRTPGKGSKA
jgi:hypothetical protein